MTFEEVTSTSAFSSDESFDEVKSSCVGNQGQKALFVRRTEEKEHEQTRNVNGPGQERAVAGADRKKCVSETENTKNVDAAKTVDVARTSGVSGLKRSFKEALLGK